MTRIPYNPALDGLRAIAVLLVVAFHTRTPGFEGGFVGVDLFFVLSGFLITRILLTEARQNGKIEYLGFFTNRALRLVPPLVLMLVAFLAAAPFIWHRVDAWLSAAVAFFYLSDYVHAFTPYPQVIHHTWSLAIEEHFYLVWPFLLVWLARAGKAKPSFFLALWAAATIWRAANIPFLDWDAVYYRFDTHATGLILGSYLATAGFAIEKRRTQHLVYFAGLIGLAATTIALRWESELTLLLGLTVAEIASAFLIVSAGKGFPLKLLSWRPLVFIGLISYSVYLWHYPIARIFRGDNWPAALILTLGFSIAISSLSWFALEKPLRRLRRKLVFTGLRARVSKQGK